MGYGKSSNYYEGDFEYRDFLFKLAEILSDVIADK